MIHFKADKQNNEMLQKVTFSKGLTPTDLAKLVCSYLELYLFIIIMCSTNHSLAFFSPIPFLSLSLFKSWVSSIGPKLTVARLPCWQTVPLTLCADPCTACLSIGREILCLLVELRKNSFHHNLIPLML